MSKFPNFLLNDSEISFEWKSSNQINYNLSDKSNINCLLNDYNLPQCRHVNPYKFNYFYLSLLNVQEILRIPI